jgi:hypothetical protein
MTPVEKLIYNKYLAISRSSQDKPFKLRKDFSNMDETTSLHIKKLSLFFNKFKHIDMDSFFKAPYEIYIDDISFDLSFYTTQRALKVYTLYVQRTASSKPDNDDQLHDIKRSLRYILSFCIQNNIDVQDYINHKTNDTYTFLLHLKEHKVNIYTLFGFTEFENNISSVNRELSMFIAGSYIENLPKFRTNYVTSSRAKILIKQGLTKISDIQQKS